MSENVADRVLSFRIEAHAVWKATEETPKPDVSFVPSLARRRLTEVERAAIAVAWRVRPEEEVPVVFASRWGEIGVTAKLMRQFHEEGEMSPAGFSASVHNAAPGVFSLLTGNRAAYNAVAARERSLEMGLLEAMAVGGPVLYVYAEEATPGMYEGALKPAQTACSVAVRLAPGEGKGAARAMLRRSDASPAQFDSFVDFLEGRAATFDTAQFSLAPV